MTIPAILNLYIFLGMPAYVYFITKALRKNYDITTGMFIGVVIVSIFPFTREVLLIALLDIRPFFNKTIFKKYE